MSQENNLTADHYFLEAETNGAIVSININDVPVIRTLDTDSINSTIPMNTWLIKGENTISFLIQPPTDAQKDYKPEIKASIFLHDSKSETPSPKKILAHIEYPNNKTTGDIKYPVNHALTFTFEESIPNKLWVEAKEINTISSDDKKEIYNLITSLTKSILNNDAKQSIDLQSYKINEEALSVNKPYSELEEALQSQYKWLETQANLSSNIADINDLNFKVCGNKKLIYVTRLNKKNAVAFESEDLAFEIEIFVANINGRWTIAR